MDGTKRQHNNAVKMVNRSMTDDCVELGKGLRKKFLLPKETEHQDGRFPNPDPTINQTRLIIFTFICRPSSSHP